MSVLNMYSQENFGRTEEFKNNILGKVFKELVSCEMNNFNSLSELNEHSKIWKECKLPIEIRTNPYIITYKMEFFKSPTYYQEIYYTEDGELIFAQESELFITKNKDTIPWNCKYFFEDGKLVDLITHGHAKSESDNWKPELILEKYRKRLSEYQSD